MSGASAIVGVLITRWLEEYYELMDACELPDLLVKHGLATKTKYDPEKHGPNNCDAEPGDDWYVLTAAGKRARKAGAA